MDATSRGAVDTAPDAERAGPVDVRDVEAGGIEQSDGGSAAGMAVRPGVQAVEKQPRRQPRRRVDDDEGRAHANAAMIAA